MTNLAPGRIQRVCLDIILPTGDHGRDDVHVAPSNIQIRLLMQPLRAKSLSLGLLISHLAYSDKFIRQTDHYVPGSLSAPD